MIAQYEYPKGIKHRVFLEGTYRNDGAYELEVILPNKQTIRAVAQDSDTAIRLASSQLEKIFGVNKNA